MFADVSKIQKMINDIQMMKEWKNEMISFIEDTEFIINFKGVQNV
jgi:hypothetical protein